MTSSSELTSGRRCLRAVGATVAVALWVAVALTGCTGGSDDAREAYDRGVSLASRDQPVGAEEAFFAALRSDSEFEPAHEALHELWQSQYERSSTGTQSAQAAAIKVVKSIEAEYAKLAIEKPGSAGINLAYGTMLYKQYDPRAESYLQRAAKLNPKSAAAWSMLAKFSANSGDPRKVREYAHRAATLDPENVDYQYADLFSLEPLDRPRWISEGREFARKYPTHERAAQTLYWIARALPDLEAIGTYEALRRDFPPERFEWSGQAMQDLFEVYLRSDDPGRATALAKGFQAQPPSEVGGVDKSVVAKAWGVRYQLAEAYTEIVNKQKAGDAQGARALSGKLPAPDPRSDNAALIVRLKAAALAASGQSDKAYETLLDWAVKQPTDEMFAALRNVGKELGKSQSKIAEEFVRLRIQNSAPAPKVAFREFGSDRRISLDDYHGKIVLLSFWYPGCGPCRAEFPRLDNVIRSLRSSDLVFLGPNGLPEQDALVERFVKNSGHLFTPLKTTKEVTGPTGFKVRGYPANFVIDREGRIAYKDFMLQSDTAEKLLLAQIQMLLQEPDT